MSVAAKIADNLTFADDVSDENVKHKPILAEYIETESGKKSNSLQLLAALAMYRKTNSILIVAKLDSCQEMSKGYRFQITQVKRLLVRAGLMS